MGKTTLFNSLTGQDEHTGNWAGVTVGVKQAQAGDVTVTDLPGIYSFDCLSMEEQVAKDHLLTAKGTVFDVLECKNLSRGLFFALQLVERGIFPVLLVNMTESVVKRGGKFFPAELSDELGLTVIEIDARDPAACKKAVFGAKVRKDISLPYLDKLPFKAMSEISGVTDRKTLFELFCDPHSAKKLGLSDEQERSLARELQKYGDAKQYLTQLRYEYIDSFIDRVLICPQKTSKAEKLFFNKFFSLAAFLLFIGFAFWLVFSSRGPGGFLVSLLDSLLQRSKSWAAELLAPVPAWLSSFVTDVALEGVGVVAKFLPQVLLLFFLLNLLEDTGYISRIAFIFDGALKKVGLSGKSVFTLLLSLGCNTTAVATANNLDNPEVKKRTLLLAPFFPCSAKVPVFLTVMAMAAPVFTGFEIYVLLALYIVCIALAFFIASLFKLFGKKQPQTDFVLELSEIRLPSLKRVVRSVFKNAKSFVARLVGILFLCVAVVWALKSFDSGFRFVSEIDKSLLAALGKGIAPFFHPIGIFDWRICVALLLGVTAKEVVAGTLIMLFGSTFAGAVSWQSAVVVLLFASLYVPCISTVAMIKKECGTKTALLSVAINTCTAYLVCFVFHTFSSALQKNAPLIIAVVCGMVFIALCAFFVLKYKNRCRTCKNRAGCVNERAGLP